MCIGVQPKSDLSSPQDMIAASHIVDVLYFLHVFFTHWSSTISASCFKFNLLLLPWSLTAVKGVVLLFLYAYMWCSCGIAQRYWSWFLWCHLELCGREVESGVAWRRSLVRSWTIIRLSPTWVRIWNLLEAFGILSHSLMQNWVSLTLPFG